MNEKIYKIYEIRDDKNGVSTVNSFLEKGWTFISACQVGTAEAMDIVYVIGATKEVYENTLNRNSLLKNALESEL